MRPVGIGLAGLGRWGRNYVKTLLGLPECRLAAVADPDPAALAAVANLTDVSAYESASELLDDPAIEAVVIATPDCSHYPLAAAALEAGRDVLVEKPMTLTVSEAETIVRKAEDSRRVLAVGHTAVYSTDTASLRTRLEALPRAARRRVLAERTSSGPPFADSSSVNRHSAIIFDLCPHDIALAVLVFGTPIAARARSNGADVEYEVRFERDGLLEGRAAWREPPHVRRFEVADASGLADVAHAGPLPPDVRDTPLGLQCLDFIDSCRTRKQPLSNGRLSLTVVRCLNALAASVRNSSGWLPLAEPAISDPGRRITDSGLRPLEIGVRT